MGILLCCFRDSCCCNDDYKSSPNQPMPHQPQNKYHNQIRNQNNRDLNRGGRHLVHLTGNQRKSTMDTNKSRGSGRNGHQSSDPQAGINSRHAQKSRRHHGNGQERNRNLNRDQFPNRNLSRRTQRPSRQNKSICPQVEIIFLEEDMHYDANHKRRRARRTEAKEEIQIRTYNKYESSSSEVSVSYDHEVEMDYDHGFKPDHDHGVGLNDHDHEVDTDYDQEVETDYDHDVDTDQDHEDDHNHHENHSQR